MPYADATITTDSDLNKWLVHNTTLTAPILLVMCLDGNPTSDGYIPH